jgi:cystathionine beta-lyase/cystathionine gamma-synthase
MPGDSTTALHGGRQFDPTTGAILTPIYQSTTFVQEAVGRDRGFTYTRCGNPTVVALERRLGALEEAPPAVAFATGMAAISALCLVLLSDGGHAVVSQVVYGGTVRLLDRVLSRFGVTATFVDASDPEAVRGALRPETRLVLVETPANPTLDLVDIEAVAELARGAEVPLAVDNTFLTPVLQRPLELGAEASVYSTTKFLEGHNATVGGAVVTRDATLLERLRFVRNALGIGQTPFQAWLTLRGIGTLPVRMRAHSRGAERVARWLERQSEVARVAYPTLASFPQRELALRQQRDGGGLVVFELLGGEAAGVRLMNAVRLCSLAENLGAVETLITHPASMTHADVPAAQRRRAGITDGLVRLSVGLEDPDDLIADLERALEAAS